MWFLLALPYLARLRHALTVGVAAALASPPMRRLTRPLIQPARTARLPAASSSAR
jgi:hypothetical protein